MSIQAAIGAIDQIYTLRQQLLDPEALVTGGSAASSSGGASLTADGASSAPSTDFATALASAQGLSSTSPTSEASELAGAAEMPGTSGLTGTSALSDLTDPSGTSGTSALSDLTDPAGTSGLTGPSSLTGATGLTGLTGTTGGAVPTQVQSMIDQANSLVGKPYVWGGGHSGWGPQAGYDCSGFVSAVLHAGGYLSAPQDTQTLPSQPGIESGPGQYVTIYDRTDAGNGDDHVIIDLNGQFYESGGEAGSWGGGGGVEKISTPSAAYLATFNDILHPAGL